MLAVAWPFGCPPRFTDTGSAQTRFAQTMPASSPVPAALLGHATRPRNLQEKKRLGVKSCIHTFSQTLSHLSPCSESFTNLCGFFLWGLRLTDGCPVDNVLHERTDVGIL